MYIHDMHKKNIVAGDMDIAALFPDSELSEEAFVCCFVSKFSEEASDVDVILITVDDVVVFVVGKFFEETMDGHQLSIHNRHLCSLSSSDSSPS